EDGIRDKLVTGVQTCALPISVVQCDPAGPHRPARRWDAASPRKQIRWHPGRSRRLPEWTETSFFDRPDRIIVGLGQVFEVFATRSEERRVGKEWRSRWWAAQ